MSVGCQIFRTVFIAVLLVSCLDGFGVLMFAPKSAPPKKSLVLGRELRELSKGGELAPFRTPKEATKFHIMILIMDFRNSDSTF